MKTGTYTWLSSFDVIEPWIETRQARKKKRIDPVVYLFNKKRINRTSIQKVFWPLNLQDRTTLTKNLRISKRWSFKVNSATGESKQNGAFCFHYAYRESPRVVRGKKVTLENSSKNEKLWEEKLHTIIVYSFVTSTTLRKTFWIEKFPSSIL